MKPFGTNYNQSAATPPMGRRPPPRQIPASVYSRQRLGNPKVPQPCQPPDDRSAALAATGGLAKEAEASPRASRSASRATLEWSRPLRPRTPEGSSAVSIGPANLTEQRLEERHGRSGRGSTRCVTLVPYHTKKQKMNSR